MGAVYLLPNNQGKKIKLDQKDQRRKPKKLKVLPSDKIKLYHTILYYILHYTILYYTILYYTILYYTILYYTILYYTILCYTILYYTIGATAPRQLASSQTQAPKSRWFVGLARRPTTHDRIIGLIGAPCFGTPQYSMLCMSSHIIEYNILYFFIQYYKIFSV